MRGQGRPQQVDQAADEDGEIEDLRDGGPDALGVLARGAVAGTLGGVRASGGRAVRRGLAVSGVAGAGSGRRGVFTGRRLGRCGGRRSGVVGRRGGRRLATLYRLAGSRLGRVPGVALPWLRRGMLGRGRLRR